MGPTTKVRATRVASMAVQHAVDVITSLASFGTNKSLSGWKCEPRLPGLLDHCPPKKIAMQEGSLS